MTRCPPRHGFSEATVCWALCGFYILMVPWVPSSNQFPFLMLSPFPIIHQLIRISQGSEFGNGRLASSDTANMRGNHGRGGATGSGWRALSPGLWGKKALAMGK